MTYNTYNIYNNNILPNYINYYKIKLKYLHTIF